MEAKKFLITITTSLMTMNHLVNKKMDHENEINNVPILEVTC